MPYRKTDKFLYFYCRYPMRVTLFSKSPYLTAHNQIDYKNKLHWKFSEKKQQNNNNKEMYHGPSKQLRRSSLWH